MTTIQTLEIRNVTLDSLDPRAFNRFALSWELGDARFHIWFDRPFDLDPDAKTLTAEDHILYKNPPHGIGRDDAGNYWTRQLNPAAKTNAKHVEAARRIAVTDNLYDKAVAAIKADRETAKRDAETLARKQRIQDHGPKLLDALRLAEKAIDGLFQSEYGRREIGEEVSLIDRRLVAAGREASAAIADATAPADTE